LRTDQRVRVEFERRRCFQRVWLRIGPDAIIPSTRRHARQYVVTLAFTSTTTSLTMQTTRSLRLT